MDDPKVRKSPDTHGNKRNGHPSVFNPAFDFFVQIPQKLQNCLKSIENEGKANTASSLLTKEKESYTALEANLEKQMLAWRENPTWMDQPPEIKVSVPKGSLCNLNVKFEVGLPPDAIYNIVTDPDNRRVFKNIKEVISRRVLIDEGLRQVVDVEQAALWRFLWWSGTISVHVLVDQNRKDHSVKFKQCKSGFMKRFEGCWNVEPLFVDEKLCFPYKPKSWVDYESCTRGKGRVGSIVSLEQLIQPALLPPPPISWYIRGITMRTTEMLISDLLAECARIREPVNYARFNGELDLSTDPINGCTVYKVDIKERWHHRRRNTRRRKSSSRLLSR